MQHIGILPKGFLGDIILTSPVIEALRESFPTATLTVVAPPVAAGLLAADPLINRVITFDRRREYSGVGGMLRFAARLRDERFDAIFSFQRSPRSAILPFVARIPRRVGFSDAFLGLLYSRRVIRTSHHHEVLRNLELVYSDLSPEVRAKVDRLHNLGSGGAAECLGSFGKLRVPEVPAEELSPRVLQILGDPRPFVVLSPSSAWETKRWFAEGFKRVAHETLRAGERVVIVGAPSDAEVCERVAHDTAVCNLCGITSISDLIALIARAACVVCNDSLALHIASATGTPSVVVFCATSPRFGFGPWRSPSIVLEKEGLFCKPCRRHGSNRCPQGTEACMRGVSAEEVLGAMERVRELDGRWSGGECVATHK